MNRFKIHFTFLITIMALSFFSLAQAESLKPFILGKTVPGTMAEVVKATTEKLSEQGFTVVGKYSPYLNATVPATLK